MTINQWLLEGIIWGIFCELGIIMCYQLILLTPIFKHLSQYRISKGTSSAAIKWFTVAYFSLIGVFFELMKTNSGSYLLSTNFIMLMVIMLIGIIAYWQDLLVVGLLAVMRILIDGFDVNGLLQTGIAVAFVLTLMLIRVTFSQKSFCSDYWIQCITITLF